MKLKRSRDGRTIHALDCKIGASVSWRWADDKSRYEVQKELSSLGINYRECKRCEPFARYREENYATATEQLQAATEVAFMVLDRHRQVNDGGLYVFDEQYARVFIDMVDVDVRAIADAVVQYVLETITWPTSVWFPPKEKSSDV